MQGGNGPEDPLRTVVVNFKGAVQFLGRTDLAKDVKQTIYHM